jgi:TolB-like protein/Tfp pilus assembly protein PilF
MSEFLQRLKERKLVQWAVAYLAGAWALLQVLDLAANGYGWPLAVIRIAFAVIALGFVVTLLLAWYHGERGAQRVGGVELLLLAGVFAIGGFLIWHYAAPAQSRADMTAAAFTKASSSDLAAQGSAAPAPEPTVASSAITAKSIAVLPFENLSEDKGNAYFADGMQDLILTKLADIGQLKVISRTSTMKYASHPDDLKTIAQQLGVATILEGSVQKAGNQVLINVQLIDAHTDSHLWAESYTRNLENIFGVEGEVAGKVADALKAKLSPEETSAVASISTRNSQAYTLYLKAQYEMEQFGEVDVQPRHLLQAKDDLKQAIAQDPKFARAYALLSLVQAAILSNVVESPDTSLAKAEANARKALALQPKLAEAHFALWWVLEANGHYASALQELQTAARLKPGDSLIAYNLARYQGDLGGDLQQEVVAYDKVLRLDPLNSFNYGALAYIKVRLRDYGAARQTLERGLAIRPDAQHLHVQMAQVMLLTGDPVGARAQLAPLPADARGAAYLTFKSWLYSRDYKQALQAAEQMPDRNTTYGGAGRRQAMIGVAEQLLGQKPRAMAAFDQARSAIEKALQKHPQNRTLRGSLANIEMWSGQRDQALQAVDSLIHDTKAHLRRIAEDFAKAHVADGPAQNHDAMLFDPGSYAQRAEILAHFGDAKGATELLGRLLATPGSGSEVSPATLRLDPIWDPIRTDPAFQALLEKYGRAQPARGDSAAP